MLGGPRGHQRICGTARLQHTASSCKNNTCNTLIINTLLHLATVFTSYKNRTCNTLIINTLLHSATVGVGFIPILLTAGEMKRELHRRWWVFSPSYCHVDDSFSQRTQRLRTANHGQCVFLSDKNKKNPCRDARAAPSVSFWYRRTSKQASARRHQKETAFVPQACITARKTRKTAVAAGIYSTNAKPRRGCQWKRI